MRTFIRLKNRQPQRLPAEFRDQDLRYAPELVALFIQRYTHAGDLVFDPFAGYGTTLIVAEQMDRAAYGIELDPRRVAYVRTQLRNPESIRQGNTLLLRDDDIPSFDLTMT